MTTVSEVVAYLEDLAPLALAEDWDNVGLLIGGAEASLAAVMTCLTLTPDVAAEAVAGGAGLVVAHHPVLFRPVRRLTDATPEGRAILELMRAGTAVYSPHTGYDSAREGINVQLATALGIAQPVPLRPSENVAPEKPGSQATLGAGRCGLLPDGISLAAFIQRVCEKLGIEHVQYVGDPTRIVRRVGIACGSAAELIPDAIAAGCDVLLTGEARFHACLEARESGLALVLAGHYATERPAMERLAEMLRTRFPELKVWASETESDPLRWA